MAPTGGTARTRRHRVVIIGSGFGGLFAAKELKDADVDVTLISRTTHHLFQPLLYQVATGILSEGEIAPATREVLRKQKNLDVLLGDVYAIDLAARTVTSRALDLTTVTPYDSLIVAAGASTSYFGNDQYALDAPGLKTVDDALELRGRILGAFEMANLATDPDEIRRLMTFVVVGAGPTGVEMAGQIAELARTTLRRDFKRIDTTQARVLLLDGQSGVLTSFGPKVSAQAAEQLSRLGIEVWLNTLVTSVDERGIEVKDTSGRVDRIDANVVVWAAGVRASTLAAKIADQAGVAGRPGRPHPGQPGRHRRRSPRGVRRRRHDDPRHAARRLPGRDAAGPVRGADHHPAPRRPRAAPAVPLRRQGIDGDDLALLGRRRHRPPAVRRAALRRVRRLVAVAGRAHLLPRRLQEPGHHPPALGGHLPRPRPPAADRHPPAGRRPGRPAPPRDPASRRPAAAPGPSSRTRISSPGRTEVLSGR